ncbi:MAG: 50S ribosomal protein L23 [Clostridia bacterium]|nr:50S ribosomal protein L23 [Clostridia bacterium]
MTYAYDIIIKPIISEQSMDQLADRKYTFEVKKSANKVQIKQAIEEIFGVKVESVNTLNMMGKMKRMGRYEGRRASWKKAIVKLTPDSKTIEFFDGMA